jgi:tetratricopeptide (TPR) repeat protein
MIPIPGPPFAALCAWMTAATPTIALAGPPIAAGMARLDALHARRDQPGAIAEARRIADGAISAAPADYGVLWRAARAAFDDSDDLGRSPDERSRIAKQAYDLAERAIAINPNDAAAQYWAALAIGNYAESMGVVRALANGIEGKFKRPLERATALDERYDYGNVPVVWAAYYLELPWPKRDRARAARELEHALAINPANLRARYYKARIAVDEGRPAEAKALLAEIAAAPVGRYDAPDERRVKQDAAKLAASLR